MSSCDSIIPLITDRIRINNQPYDSWAKEALDIAKVLDPKKAKGEALKLRTKGLVLQNPLPGYDPRNRRFTQSRTDATSITNYNNKR